MPNRELFFLCNWLKFYILATYKTKEIQQLMSHGKFYPKGADLV